MNGTATNGEEDEEDRSHEVDHQLGKEVGAKRWYVVDADVPVTRVL